MQKHIVIIGAGFGGVRVALDLARHNYGDIRITLINKTSYHSYTPDFYEVASAFLKENSPEPMRFLSLKSTVSIPLQEIFSKYPSVRVVVDEAARVDCEERIVYCASGKNYAYDWLVVAPGSETNYFNIPNLPENSYALKTPEEALNIRNAIDEFFYKKAKHEPIKIVIGGGGFSGCELAAEFAGYAKKLARLHAHPKGNVEIVILEAGNSVLGGAGEWAQKRAATRLEKMGIKVLTESSIEKVDNQKVFIKGGNNLAYDILIWTAGVWANRLTASVKSAHLASKGCIETDEYLRAKSHDNVFVIGDAGYCYDPRMNAPVPMTAQMAIHQGRYVAYTVRRLINKRKPFPYIPIHNKFVIPLGGKYALADLGKIKISGFMAWALRRLVALKYWMSVLPFFEALTLWWISCGIFKAND